MAELITVKKFVLAKDCANYHLQDGSCGMCGCPAEDYTTPFWENKDVCGFAADGITYPKRLALSPHGGDENG